VVVKKSWLGLVVCAFVLPAAAQAPADASAAPAAAAADGKLVNVPANTLSIADGKLTTSLTKSEVLALR
jgi:hypothetical protein